MLKSYCLSTVLALLFVVVSCVTVAGGAKITQSGLHKSDLIEKAG